MTQDHPITPPPELVQQWILDKQLGEFYSELNDPEQYFATQAARWGADQELEACCAEMNDWGNIHHSCGLDLSNFLRAHRRPKPPSLKEQAQRILVENGTTLDGRMELDPDDIAILRRALEQLDD
jgi:hypothetical protein